MTEIEKRALVILARGPTTCAVLGSELWANAHPGAGNCSCPFARPAGSLIKKLRARGLVERHYPDRRDPRTLYTVTEAGMAHVNEMAPSC